MTEEQEEEEEEEEEEQEESGFLGVGYCVSEMYSGQYGQCEQIYCEFSFDY